MLIDFIEWAENNDWHVVRKNSETLNLSKKFTKRYTQIPYEYQEFLMCVDEFVSPSEKIWFLCESDYNNKSNSAFKWNEYEIISLDAAGKDRNWKREIISWWDKYLPIVMSVQDGYSYYAIDLYNEKGAIVEGCEPEFEEVTKIADNLEDFFDLIIKNKISMQ